jgi:hypothetical protein
MKYRTPLITAALLASLFAGCSKHSPDAIRTKKEPSPGQPTQQQVQVAKREVDSFTQVRTRPLSLEHFSQAVHLRAGTNVDDMSANEREKLFTCIDQFYRCYSSGDFEAFKRFRLRPPFTVSERLASAVKEIASQKGLPLKSDEDVIHVAWDNYNGTNKIGQVNEGHFILSVATGQDLRPDLRQPSVGRFSGSGASCWEGAVVYQPTPAELLNKHGSLRFFTLEIIVRFSPLVGGPATPLVLMGYWDPTRNDWMPYALCTVFHVGSYDTIF